MRNRTVLVVVQEWMDAAHPSDTVLYSILQPVTQRWVQSLLLKQHIYQWIVSVIIFM